VSTVDADSFTPYSQVGNRKRQVIQAAAYNLRDAITDAQNVLAQAENVPACPAEEEEEEECVHPQPVEALEAVCL
jgi:hypothetical protein